MSKARSAAKSSLSGQSGKVRVSPLSCPVNRGRGPSRFSASGPRSRSAPATRSRLSAVSRPGRSATCAISASEPSPSHARAPAPMVLPSSRVAPGWRSVTVPAARDCGTSTTSCASSLASSAVRSPRNASASGVPEKVARRRAGKAAKLAGTVSQCAASTPRLAPCASSSASCTRGGLSVPLAEAVMSAPACRPRPRRRTSLPPSAAASRFSASISKPRHIARSAPMRRLTSSPPSASPSASHGSRSSRANSSPRPSTGRSPQRQVAVPATRLPSALAAMSLKAAWRSSSISRSVALAGPWGRAPASERSTPIASSASCSRRACSRSAHSLAFAVPAPDAVMRPSPGSSAVASGTRMRPFSSCTVRRSRRSEAPRKVASSAERSSPIGSAGVPPSRSAWVQASRSSREATSAASSRGPTGEGVGGVSRSETPPRARCPASSSTRSSTPTSSAVAVMRPEAVKAPRGVGSRAERSAPAASSLPSKPPSASKTPRAAMRLPDAWPLICSGAVPSSPARPREAAKLSGWPRQFSRPSATKASPGPPANSRAETPSTLAPAIRSLLSSSRASSEVSAPSSPSAGNGPGGQGRRMSAPTSTSSRTTTRPSMSHQGSSRSRMARAVSSTPSPAVPMVRPSASSTVWGNSRSRSPPLRPIGRPRRALAFWAKLSR